ncbi:MAG: hypothetical protein HN413_06060 [Chloroflexi bacterium]|jgi:hypothetical protein|nr:hypothetical protein [Chloroflexota bacterium]
MIKEIIYSEEINTVVITYQGQTPPEEVQEVLQKAYILAVEKNCKNFLVDCSLVQPGGGSTLDVYDLARMFEEFPDIRKYKDAIILPPIPAGAEDLKFFETAARNRGFNVRVFTERQAAIDWLME